jgi:methionine synthase II (cobalamin-independent)
VVAPARALPGAKNEHYADEKALLFALADVLHAEYKTIADAGLDVQVDNSFLPYMHEKLGPPDDARAVPRLGTASHRRPVCTENLSFPKLDSRVPLM